MVRLGAGRNCYRATGRRRLSDATSLTKAGRLAHTRIGNKNIRIAPEDLDKYLEDNTVVGETT